MAGRSPAGLVVRHLRLGRAGGGNRLLRRCGSGDAAAPAAAQPRAGARDDRHGARRNSRHSACARAAACLHPADPRRLGGGAGKGALREPRAGGLARRADGLVGQSARRLRVRARPRGAVGGRGGAARPGLAHPAPGGVGLDLVRRAGGRCGVSHPLWRRRAVAAVPPHRDELCDGAAGRMAQPRFPVLRAARTVARRGRVRRFRARLAAAADPAVDAVVVVAHGVAASPPRRAGWPCRSVAARPGARPAAEGIAGRPFGRSGRPQPGGAGKAGVLAWRRTRRRGTGGRQRRRAARRRGPPGRRDAEGRARRGGGGSRDRPGPQRLRFWRLPDLRRHPALYRRASRALRRRVHQALCPSDAAG